MGWRRSERLRQHVLDAVSNGASVAAAARAAGVPEQTAWNWVSDQPWWRPGWRRKPKPKPEPERAREPELTEAQKWRQLARALGRDPGPEIAPDGRPRLRFEDGSERDAPDDGRAFGSNDGGRHA
jgi:transposase-like protein